MREERRQNNNNISNGCGQQEIGKVIKSKSNAVEKHVHTQINYIMNYKCFK